MKKFIVSVIFSLAISVSAFAQSRLPELDKIKEIKLLESTREDVKRIFRDDDSRENAVYTENAIILFFYSGGNCSNEDEEWNVPEGKVTEIYMVIEEAIKPSDLGIDLSKLDKVSKFASLRNYFIYYDKAKGISFATSDKEFSHIKFFPTEENYPALCNNKKIRKFYSSKDWFRNKTKERRYIPEPMPVANLTDMILSKEEIVVDCGANLPKEAQSCSYDLQITVEAKAESSDPTDVLTYNYTVSGGKIIGTGANITWDLSGAKPGTYTITAGVDNGCGVCGTTRTETVIVKECPDCTQK
jgi:hypothetical protein